MQSKATTVEAYLAELSEDRREAISAVREVVLDNLPDGYEETMNWGMISYEVPLSTHPDTYNGKPLSYVALASQKNHMSIYLMGIYMYDERRAEFEAAYKATGKRFDAGKSCVRFRKLEDLPLDLVGEAVAAMPMETYIAAVETFTSPRKKKKGKS